MDPEDPDSDPDHSQNFFILPLQTYPENFIKIRKFLSYLVHKQTHKPTNKRRQKHNLLGGGNKYEIYK